MMTPERNDRAHLNTYTVLPCTISGLTASLIALNGSITARTHAAMTRAISNVVTQPRTRFDHFEVCACCVTAMVAWFTGIGPFSMGIQPNFRQCGQRPKIHLVPAAPMRIPNFPQCSINPHFLQRMRQPGARLSKAAILGSSGRIEGESVTKAEGVVRLRRVSNKAPAIAAA